MIYLWQMYNLRADTKPNAILTNWQSYSTPNGSRTMPPPGLASKSIFGLVWLLTLTFDLLHPSCCGTTGIYRNMWLWGLAKTLQTVLEISKIFTAVYLQGLQCRRGDDLGNNARYGHSYNRRRIGARVRSNKWCHDFQRSWVARNLDFEITIFFNVV